MIKGALAGLIGVGAMTAAQAVEMRITGRQPSMVPGHVASKLLGIAPWPWSWSLEELAPDVLHKGLYAAATSAAYDRLN
ncbi:MAG: hypothetical protein M3R46_02490 [Actinomycetota bacterium]|nr:hypothetical protein [Actinomycetota bacterium]